MFNSTEKNYFNTNKLAYKGGQYEPLSSIRLNNFMEFLLTHLRKGATIFMTCDLKVFVHFICLKRGSAFNYSATAPTTSSKILAELQERTAVRPHSVFYKTIWKFLRELKETQLSTELLGRAQKIELSKFREV